MKFDVIIVGAGPGGSMAALILSRAGKRVLVLEKSTFPRSKVCGYSLNPRCWPIWEKYGLAEGFKKLPHFDIAGFTLEKEGVTVVRHPFRSHRTRTVERAVLDEWLALEAQKSGAQFQFGVTVKSISEAKIHTSAGDYHAPMIIGADGRNSVVGRMRRLDRPSSPCARIAWQAFVEVPALGDHVHMNVFPEGYYGLNRIDEKRTNITIVLFSDAKIRPEEIMRRYLPDSTWQAWKSVHPISRCPWEVTDGQAWLVGDAARILEPMTGEGIYSALATAEMASHNILSLDKVGARAAAANYRRQHRQLYGARTLINSWVRWVLEDSDRGMRIMNFLALCPSLVGHLVEWVQSPAKSHSMASKSIDHAQESAQPQLQS